MRLGEVILDKEDVEAVFESLCESHDTDIADSPLTDMFALLVKSDVCVGLNIIDDDEDNFMEAVTDILDEVDDLDDLEFVDDGEIIVKENPTEDSDCWRTEKEPESSIYWAVDDEVCDCDEGGCCDDCCDESLYP